MGKFEIYHIRTKKNVSSLQNSVHTKCSINILINAKQKILELGQSKKELRVEITTNSYDKIRIIKSMFSIIFRDEPQIYHLYKQKE